MIEIVGFRIVDFYGYRCTAEWDVNVKGKGEYYGKVFRYRIDGVLRSIAVRDIEHWSQALSGKFNSKLDVAMRKHPRANWELFYITSCYEADAATTEGRLILEHCSLLNGLNMTLGGEGCFTITEEQRNYLSQLNRKYPDWTLPVGVNIQDDGRFKVKYVHNLLS